MTAPVRTARVRLGVNIDHVATIRNARGGPHPDPVRAAELAIAAGADGVTLHVREDRRHVREDDLERMSRVITAPINLELACAEEMIAIAERARPHAACLVPERREERTTEGGLDVARQHNIVAPAVRRLTAAGSRVSLFIDPEPEQVAAAIEIGAPVIEMHTGAYCEAFRAGDAARTGKELAALEKAAAQASMGGLEVHAGHGIDFDSVGPIARIPALAELNIGHFLIGEAVFIGLAEAIAEMRRRIDQARAALLETP